MNFCLGRPEANPLKSNLCFCLCPIGHRPEGLLQEKAKGEANGHPSGKGCESTSRGCKNKYCEFFWSRLNLSITRNPVTVLDLFSIFTLKQPSASVRPDNQASFKVGLINLSIKFISLKSTVHLLPVAHKQGRDCLFFKAGLLEAKVLFKACIQELNWDLRCSKTKLPLNNKVNS